MKKSYKSMIVLLVVILTALALLPLTAIANNETHNGHDDVNSEWTIANSLSSDSGAGTANDVQHDSNQNSLELAAGTVAVNTDTGLEYTGLANALNDAKAKETVTLMCNLTGQGAVEVQSDVILDLNGYDLEADVVTVFAGLVMNSKGSSNGKLIVPKANFKYTHEKEMTGTDNMLPVWENNGYVFCGVSEIWQQWKVGLDDAQERPKYRFLPGSSKINKILGVDSGIKVCVDIEYKKNGEEDQLSLPTMIFSRNHIEQVLESPRRSVMFVSFSGTDQISAISAKAGLKAENCNFSIVSTPIETTKSAIREMSYAEYCALSADEQYAYYKSFPSVDDFMQWHNAAKEAYDKEHPVIPLNPGDVIDLGD